MQQTNLNDIVQNPNERVAILKPRRHASFSVISHKKATYVRNIWNLGHLYLTVLTVVRVIRKGFCRGPEVSGPKQDTFCSKALDEDAVILACGWTIL